MVSMISRLSLKVSY